MPQRNYIILFLSSCSLPSEKLIFVRGINLCYWKSMKNYTNLSNLQSLEKQYFLCLIKVCLISFIHLRGFICTLQVSSMAFCALVLKIWNPTADKATKSNVPTMFSQQASFYHQHMRKKRLLVLITRWQCQKPKNKAIEKQIQKSHSVKI